MQLCPEWNVFVRCEKTLSFEHNKQFANDCEKSLCPPPVFQWCSHKFQLGGLDSLPLPILSPFLPLLSFPVLLPIPYLPLSSPSPPLFSSLLLEGGPPKIHLGSLGERCEFPKQE